MTQLITIIAQRLPELNDPPLFCDYVVTI